MANWKRSSWSGPYIPQPGPDLETSSSAFEMSSATNAWRTRRIGEMAEETSSEPSNIMRWDGAARTCSSWDSLRRDSELWYRNGNCFVHLYKRGQSGRGPSFKVPFDALLEAKCHPLISRFIARDVLAHRHRTAQLGHDDLNVLQRASPGARIELYIPPPAMASRETSQRYYIAMRNFFAWVFRRSMVGEHLGMALVWLLNTMSQLRCPGEDNMGDLVSYMDEEGYLDMRNQPVHALAILHFAEYFQCRSLYIDAFTHCTGMSDRLFLVPEYQIITSVTRKLIRQAKAEMDLKLARAGLMLRNFLEDDLTEANTGLSSTSRAHLERFRSFLLAYFATRLGFYPPGSSDPRSYLFDPEIYRIMRIDLDALYEFLVDKNISYPENVPIQGHGGPSTLQTLHGFDLRNRFAPLRHPLPLLPDIAPSAASRRISWLNKTDKLKPDQRLVSHSALMKATNRTDAETLKNPLVAAYRKFEEDSVFWPLKADRTEKLSQVDARKTRWILIYAIYQVVRSCTQAPRDCHDTEGVDYHVAVNTANLPPWREARQASSLVRRQSERPKSGYSTSVPSMPIKWPTGPPPVTKVTTAAQGFRPRTVDYITHKLKKGVIPPAISTNIDTSNSSKPVIPPRIRSLNTNFRHSLQLFNSLSSSVPAAQAPPPASSSALNLHRPRNRSSYHEIVIQGYGNGTKDVFTIDELNPTAAVTVAPTPTHHHNRNTSKLITTTIQRLHPLTPDEDQLPHDSALKPQPLSLRSPSASSTSSGLSAATSASMSSIFSEASGRASTVSSAPSRVASFGGSATSPVGTDSKQHSDPVRSGAISTSIISCGFKSNDQQQEQQPPHGRPNPPLLPRSMGTAMIPTHQKCPSTSSSVYSDSDSASPSSSGLGSREEPPESSPPPPALPRKNSRRKLASGGLHPCPLRIKKSPPTTQLVTVSSNSGSARATAAISPGCLDGWGDIAHDRDMFPLPLSLSPPVGSLHTV